MKFVKSALFAAAALAFSANANADLNVATVDVQKLMDSYYKTHEAVAEINKAYQEVQKTFNSRTEMLKTMEKDFNDMVAKLRDPMLNDADKKKLEQKIQIKRQEVIALDQERKGYAERMLKSLQETMRQRTTGIIAEISKLTETISAEKKYDIVMDKSAKTPRSNNVFMFNSPSMDINNTVLKELNKNSPAGFDPTKKPGAPAVPNTTAQPAAK